MSPHTRTLLAWSDNPMPYYQANLVFGFVLLAFTLLGVLILSIVWKRRGRPLLPRIVTATVVCPFFFSIYFIAQAFSYMYSSATSPQWILGYLVPAIVYQGVFTAMFVLESQLNIVLSMVTFVIFISIEVPILFVAVYKPTVLDFIDYEISIIVVISTVIIVSVLLSFLPPRGAFLRWLRKDFYEAVLYTPERGPQGFFETIKRVLVARPYHPALMLFPVFMSTAVLIAAITQSRRFVRPYIIFLTVLCALIMLEAILLTIFACVRHYVSKRIFLKPSLLSLCFFGLSVYLSQFQWAFVFPLLCCVAIFVPLWTVDVIQLWHGVVMEKEVTFHQGLISGNPKDGESTELQDSIKFPTAVV